MTSLETPTESFEDHLRGPARMKIRMKREWVKGKVTEVTISNEIKWKVKYMRSKYWLKLLTQNKPFGEVQWN